MAHLPSVTFFLFFGTLLFCYAFFKKAWIWQTIFLLSGAAILLFAFPHEKLWDLSFFEVFWSEGKAHGKILGLQKSFSLWPLLSSLALFLTGMIVFSPKIRSSFSEIFKPRINILGFLLFSGLLLFSLFPADQGKEIAFFFLLSTLGFSLFILGLFPWFKKFSWLFFFLKKIFFPIPEKIFLSLLFLLSFLLFNLGSFFLFDHIPHIVDSIDQLFHSKIFLLGKLWVPSPEPKDAFFMTHMINNGKWYSQYPPGHIFLLALGQFFQIPWIIGPLFGALNLLVIYALAKELYGELTGRISVLLALLSPFLFLMASSFMNHTPCSFFLLLFSLGFFRMEKTKRNRDAILCGLSLGLALLIRPLTALAFSLPFVVFFGLKIPREGWGFLKLGLVAVFCFGIGFSLLLTYNHLTNGDPLVFGYEVLHGKKSLLGFGKSGWWGHPHTPIRGFLWTCNNLNALNQYLFWFPIPALFFAFFSLLLTPKRSGDFLLLASFFSLALGYFFYWYQDWALGPRFLFSSLGPLIILSARSLVALPSFLKSFVDQEIQARIFFGLLLGIILGLIFHLPSFLKQYHREYADGSSKVFRQAKERKYEKALVLVPRKYYPTLFPLNDPLLRTDTIYVNDLGHQRNLRLKTRFPERNLVYLELREDNPKKINQQ